VRKQRTMWHWLLALVLMTVAGTVGTSLVATAARAPRLKIDTRGLPDVSVYPIPSETPRVWERPHPPTVVFLVQTKRGWQAFVNRSTHLGEPVVWNEQRNRFLDNVSGAVWDQEGRPIAGPAPRGLDGYRVTMDGDYAIVDLSRPVVGGLGH
jgi:hypothetical protein